MIKTVLKIALLAAVVSLPTPAVILELGNNGVISGLPGEFVGWDYRLTNDEPYPFLLVITGAYFFDSGNSYPLSTLVSVLPSGESTGWQYYTTPGNGLSAFQIPADAEPGWFYGGEDNAIEISYDLYYATYDVERNAWGYLPEDFIASEVVTAYAEVDVAPEPTTAALFAGAGLLLLAALSRRRA